MRGRRLSGSEPVFLRALLALLALLLVAAPSTPNAQAQMPESTPAQPHARDHVLVKVASGTEPLQLMGESGEEIVGRWRRYPVGAGMSAEETVKDLRTRPGVEAVELDYLVQIAEGPYPSTLAAAPNDPHYPDQWHLGTVQAEDAWAASTGEGVTVAVADTGVAQGEDLDCHTFTAPYNVIAGTSDASDDHGHGSHVAGTVAQCTNNGVGVAGVASSADLMPIKVLDSSGSGAVSNVAEAIDWARSHGADVINLSLGCNCSNGAVDEAIENAADEGIIIVAASGNQGSSSVFYPASHPDVIAVGATDIHNERPPYSNYGNKLDLVAPGGDTGDGVLQESLDNTNADSCPLPSGTAGSAYCYYHGTSMATAHVSGAAALLKSVAPSADGADVRKVLTSTALDLGPGGHDDFHGAGLIQIRDALETVDTTSPVWASPAELSVASYGETELSFVWDTASDNVGVAGYLLRVGEVDHPTSSTRATVTGLQPAVSYSIEVVARDEIGNSSDPLSALVWTAQDFGDTDNSIFYNDILWLSGTRTTRGCNPPDNDLFCPDDPVSRGQIAAFLARALGLAEDTHAGFEDVSSANTFVDDIGKLATAGITRGCNPPDNDLFCPDDPVTRGQVAAFLVRALGLTEDDHSGFVDVPALSTFASDIGRLATAGITKGCNPPDNDRFCPEEPVTRGELAAFLRRAPG